MVPVDPNTGDSTLNAISMEAERGPVRFIHKQEGPQSPIQQGPKCDIGLRLGQRSADWSA